MSAKRWRLIVTELGDSTPLSEVVVDATNWMAALSTGRAQLGEAAGVPAGASCAVAPNGDVTVQDAKAQRTYYLSQRPAGAPSPAAAPSAPAQPPRAPSAAAPAPAAPSAPAAGRRKKNRAMSRTMAYIPAAELPKPPGAAPEKPKRAPQRTMAFIPQGDLPPRPPVPRPSAPQPAPTPMSFGASLVVSRDEEPNDESPLHFRERGYVVTDGATLEEAEEYLRKELTTLRKECEGLPTGKLFTLAAYDASYRDDPSRLPVATLEYKDWSDETRIEFPLQTAASDESGMPPEGAVAMEDPERRKAIILEACQDLLFLQRPEDGVELAIRLMSEVLPTEASNGSLYDAGSRQFHLVAAGGVGALARRGAMVSATAPLIHAACQQLGAPMIHASFTSDPMAEGLEGVDATSAIYITVQHHGQLLALLQLFDRQDGQAFGPEDARVLAYVGEHLATFLYQAQA